MTSDPYIFATDTLPSDERFLPPMANGLLGWRVFSDKMHMGGVYSGEAGACHRADLPCPLAVRLKLEEPAFLKVSHRLLHTSSIGPKKDCTDAYIACIHHQCERTRKIWGLQHRFAEEDRFNLVQCLLTVRRPLPLDPFSQQIHQRCGHSSEIWHKPLIKATHTQHLHQLSANGRCGEIHNDLDLCSLSQHCPTPHLMPQATKASAQFLTAHWQQHQHPVSHGKRRQWSHTVDHDTGKWFLHNRKWLKWGDGNLVPCFACHLTILAGSTKMDHVLADLGPVKITQYPLKSLAGPQVPSHRGRMSQLHYLLPKFKWHHHLTSHPPILIGGAVNWPPLTHQHIILHINSCCYSLTLLFCYSLLPQSGQHAILMLLPHKGLPSEMEGLRPPNRTGENVSANSTDSSKSTRGAPGSSITAGGVTESGLTTTSSETAGQILPRTSLASQRKP
ncbi:hypothetical protein SKAU_G00237020 [Synaphobranchus kaupii]|uniref:Uncharacterized protein n=1 Tax=Synaphobranchus kaupii TaxID=118154 RepID=A0A9Q1ITY6_SYNKA|nr:hypothetical protein SKAU_G00237020 [Synaphobranchus kaupii]